MMARERHILRYRGSFSLTYNNRQTDTPIIVLQGKKIVNSIYNFHHSNIPKNKTYIMPAGDTRDTLVEMYPKVFELCAEHGYNMTGRDHIIAFDTERGV